MGRGRGDPIVMDYIMSEKFGLDWKEHEAQRMYLLQVFHIAKTEYENQQIKKNR